MIVFPTTRAIREYINIQKNKNQFLDKIITIGNLFELAIRDKYNRKLIDKDLKIIYLKEVVNRVDISALGLSNSFNTFLKQSEYIFRFFNELASEYIELDTLLEYDTYVLYSDHIEVLKYIYKEYVELLEKNNYIDNFMIPNNYVINEEYISQYPKIEIYLEGYLSKFEFNIIKDLSKISTIIIKLTLNEYNKKNIKLFDFVENELEINYSYDIDLTNKTILNKNPIDKITQDITISNISSKVEQIAFIKYQITNMINKGIAPEKIVVVTPDEEFIETLKLFDNEGYFNFAVGINIKNNKIMQVIKLISKIIVDKEPKDDEKYKFLALDEIKFNELFSNNWNKEISKDIFNNILDYLFSLETNIELIEKLEQIKISLDILLFTNIESGFIKILVKDFIKLLQNKLSTITLDDTRGGKITVLGILETRIVTFDGVIVIDFNDDKIPKISIKDKFISSSLKELVKLPTIKDRENLQRYYYKSFFDKAKSIAISYVDDEQYSMSRFIVQLLPNYKQYLVKKDYSNILYNKKELKYYYNDIILDIDLSKLSWSATGLKEYLSCKRKFYFNHISKIKEHKVSLKPKSYEVGNIIHKALESAVKENNFTIEFINQFISNNQKKNPYLILDLETWKKKLVKFIQNEKLRKQHNINIYDVERDFKLTYNNIEIKGTIDRVDKYSDGSYEILDYKTSSNLKIDNKNNYKDSVDFQLEFYYLALSKDKNINSVGYYDLNNISIKPESMLKEKLQILDEHLKALKTTKVNFEPTDDIKKCKFCPYKIICDI